jgi:hypothetical protein
VIDQNKKPSDDMPIELNIQLNISNEVEAGGDLKGINNPIKLNEPTPMPDETVI